MNPKLHITGRGPGCARISGSKLPKKREATITATATAMPCQPPFAQSKLCHVYCEDPDFVDVFFCIDVSGSTQDGALIASGITACVDALAASGVNVRVGGLKFTDYLVEPSYGFTQDYAAFKQWVLLPGAGGGSSPGEQQLTALLRAAEQAPVSFVALTTDEPYDTFSPLPVSPVVVRDRLIASGCAVFIDAASASFAQPPGSGYDSPVNLAANGSIESALGSFTFPLMQAAIVGGY